MADMPEYNYKAYSNNVTFKMVPLFKICDGYAVLLYSEPFRQVCRVSQNAPLSAFFAFVALGSL
jgi:hypothetical protein